MISPTPAQQSDLDAAVEIVRAAGRTTLRWFARADLAVEAKDDGTPVTAADRAAERLVREMLAERFPEDGVLGEEEPETAGTSGRRWVVDPIDGTKAFARGVPLYSSLLALEDAEGTAVGVIGLPALDQVVYAGRGLGCFADGVPAAVSGTARLDGAYVMSSGVATWDDHALLAVKHAGGHLRTWGDGYGYAMVATGRADAMVDPIVERYDIAPMPVIIAEAGGRFTDVHGRPGAAHGSGVATNGRLHDALLAALAGRGRAQLRSTPGGAGTGRARG